MHRMQERVFTNRRQNPVERTKRETNRLLKLWDELMAVFLLCVLFQMRQKCDVFMETCELCIFMWRCLRMEKNTATWYRDLFRQNIQRPITFVQSFVFAAILPFFISSTLFPKELFGRRLYRLDFCSAIQCSTIPIKLADQLMHNKRNRSPVQSHWFCHTFCPLD